MSPIEKAARALCSLDGNPENATMDGKPLWQDYLPEVRAVLEAVKSPSDELLVEGLRLAELDGEVYHLSDFRDFVNGLLDAALAQ